MRRTGAGFGGPVIFDVGKRRDKMAGDKHQTQWSGQFGVAHELTRRGYLVTFTMGNAPLADILCRSPQGHTFAVQVKSLRTKNYFLYQNSLVTEEPELCVIFALVPDDLTQAPEYFILNKTQFLAVVKEENARLNQCEQERGRPYKAYSPGINYRTLNREEFRAAWHNLPR